MAKKAFKWEGSKADEALDKKGAKKMGMSAKRFEGSKADKAMDKKGAKRMSGRGR